MCTLILFKSIFYKTVCFEPKNQLYNIGNQLAAVHIIITLNISRRNNVK